MKEVGVFKLKGGGSRTGRIAITVTIDNIFFISLQGEGFRFSCAYWRIDGTVTLRHKIEEKKNIGKSAALLYKFLEL